VRDDSVETFFKTGKTRRSKRAVWEAEWRTNREQALRRDHGWCQHPDCDRPAQVVHHKAGRRIAEANSLDRLVSLCDPCHRFVHANPEWAYQHGLLERHG
jgi:hypothetical protein